MNRWNSGTDGIVRMEKDGKYRFFHFSPSMKCQEKFFIAMKKRRIRI